jgi:Fe-S-cluster containining protein
MSRGKHCGDCTLCCKFLSVPQLGKRMYSECKHCDPGKGCEIHETRPQVCRSYECLWLQDPDLADRLKPNVCGVLFDRPVGSQVVAGLFDPKDPMALGRPEVINFMNNLVRSGLIVGITRATRVDGVVWLKPDGMTQDEMEEEIRATGDKAGMTWPRRITLRT